MRRIARCAKLALATFASVFSFVACAGDSTGPKPIPTPVPAKVTSVTIYGGPLSLLTGATGQPDSVRATYSDNTTKLVGMSVVEWSSSSPSIATVNNVGKVSGVNPGEARIDGAVSGMIGTYQVTVMKPAAKPDSVKVFNQSPITAGALPIQFQAIQYSSDGTSKEVSSTATWSTSNATVAAVSSTGVVTTFQAGTAQICAKFGELTGCTSVTVLPAPLIGTPWSLLPYVSDSTKDYLVQGLDILNAGVIKFYDPQKMIQEITYWNNPDFPPEEVAANVEAWNTRLQGEAVFIPVADSATAKVIVWFDPTMVTGPCAEETITSVGGSIAKVRIRHSTRAECAGPGILRISLAHEYGHALGLRHTPAGRDIMSPAPRWIFHPIVVEGARWICNPLVLPGTIPR